MINTSISYDDGLLKEDDEYRLLFYLKGMQLIVMKPDSVKGPGQAWLFTKVSDYGLSK